MDMHVPDPTSRRTLAVVERYEDAQAIVDRLADSGFPVDHVMIVGRDLRFEERVTGRLNGWRAALGGLGSGLAVGALLGLLFGALFSPDGVSLLAVIVYWAVVGALLGTLFAVLTYALTGGRRDFTSVAGVTAGRYEVLADEAVADDALARLRAPAST